MLSKELITEKDYRKIDTIYKAKYRPIIGVLMERYETARNGIAEINDKMLKRTAKREKITRFLDDMKCHDKLLTEFDENSGLPPSIR